MKLTDLKPNEAIHCKTKEEAVRICGMCKNVEIRELAANWWNEHESCYYPDDDFCVSSVKYATKQNYTIHPSELFQNSTPSDEITEEGLRARGFKKPRADRDEFILDNGRYFALTSDIRFVYLRGGGHYETGTNCQTLSDIDHLIRLLGV